MNSIQTTRIRLNGVQREVPAGSCAEDLVRDLGHRPELVAVEVNRHLVPRDFRPEHVLQSGDRVEVVTLVGGG